MEEKKNVKNRSARERIIELLYDGPKTVREVVTTMLSEGFGSNEIENALKELYREKRIEAAEIAGSKVLSLTNV